MNSSSFDYLMVATFAENQAGDERYAQYLRDLRRQHELRERNRQVWAARWQAVRSGFASLTKSVGRINGHGSVATAS